MLLLEAEEQAKVLAGLDQLPTEDQEVIGLRVLDRMSWEEVAEQLDISTSTARRRFQLALRKLVDEVGE